MRNCLPSPSITTKYILYHADNLSLSYKYTRKYKSTHLQHQQDMLTQQCIEMWSWSVLIVQNKGKFWTKTLASTGCIGACAFVVPPKLKVGWRIKWAPCPSSWFYVQAIDVFIQRWTIIHKIRCPWLNVIQAFFISVECLPLFLIDAWMHNGYYSMMLTDYAYHFPH